MPIPEVDYTATVQRPVWSQLPGAVHRAVEEAAGDRVVHAADPPGSGFTGSFAAVVHLSDGRRAFAKAGSNLNEHVLGALTQEAVVLAALPVGVPAPRLIGAARLTVDDADWQVVVTEALPGRIPQPWTPRDLAAVHSACLASAAALTPAPPELSLPLLTDELTDDRRSLEYFDDVAAGTATPTWGQPAWLVEHAADLSALARLAPSATAGATGCHGDLRADNVMVDGDVAVLVDWNWLSQGAAWTDFVGVLPLARADGVDVDRLLPRSPLTEGVDPDAIDAWLSIIAAYMLASSDDPIWPGGSEWIRVHQRRYARTFLDWLGDRRGWS